LGGQSPANGAEFHASATPGVVDSAVAAQYMRVKRPIFRHHGDFPMSDSPVDLKPKPKVKPKLERPKLYKVILLNDDYTPRDFVTLVLKSVFHMGEDTGRRVMMMAHRFGSAVVVVCERDIAETKAKEATDLGKEAGFPLMFTTEPEE
jgi:ATP-dependent Clp protease adaptor protein ClpS